MSAVYMNVWLYECSLYTSAWRCKFFWEPCNNRRYSKWKIKLMDFFKQLSISNINIFAAILFIYFRQWKSNIHNTPAVTIYWQYIQHQISSHRSFCIRKCINIRCSDMLGTRRIPQRQPFLGKYFSPSEHTEHPHYCLNPFSTPLKNTLNTFQRFWADLENFSPFTSGALPQVRVTRNF